VEVIEFYYIKKYKFNAFSFNISENASILTGTPTSFSLQRQGTVGGKSQLNTFLLPLLPNIIA